MSSSNSKLPASADPSPGIALTDDEAKLKLALIDAASAGGIAAVERGITAMHAEWYAPERQCKPMIPHFPQQAMPMLAADER